MSSGGQIPSGLTKVCDSLYPDKTLVCEDAKSHAKENAGPPDMALKLFTNMTPFYKGTKR